MKVDAIGCSKKSYLLVKEYTSCELESPGRPDPYFLADVDSVTLDDDVPVGETGVSDARMHYEFEETIDCEVEDHQVHCRIPEDRR